MSDGFVFQILFTSKVNPTRIEINEGDNVTLFCNVSGTGVSSMDVEYGQT